MTGPAGRFFGFRSLVKSRFEIQWRFRILFEQLLMTGAAIAAGTLRVRGMIESDIAILGYEGELFRSLLLLGDQS